MLVKNLSSDILDEKSKSKLGENGISTVFEFIETDSWKIARLCFGNKLSTVNRLKSKLIKQCCPQVQTVNQLLCKRYTMTSIQSLDQVLGGGGLEAPKLYEIYGRSGAGKTQLATFLTLVCSESQSSTLYIDTKNNFNINRLHQMAKERLQQKCNAAKKVKRSEEDEETAIQQIMSRCHIARAFSLHQILDVLCSIEDAPKCLVIDSLAAVVVPLFGNSEISVTEISGTLSLLFSKLKQLAYEHNTSVIWLNNATVDSTTGNTKPALGKLVDGVANTRLQVKRIYGNCVQLIKDDMKEATSILELGPEGFIEHCEDRVS